MGKLRLRPLQFMHKRCDSLPNRLIAPPDPIAGPLVERKHPHHLTCSNVRALRALHGHPSTAKPRRLGKLEPFAGASRARTAPHNRGMLADRRTPAPDRLAPNPPVSPSAQRSWRDSSRSNPSGTSSSFAVRRVQSKGLTWIMTDGYGTSGGSGVNRNGKMPRPSATERVTSTRRTS